MADVTCSRFFASRTCRFPSDVFHHCFESRLDETNYTSKATVNTAFSVSECANNVNLDKEVIFTVSDGGVDAGVLVAEPAVSNDYGRNIGIEIRIGN